MDTPDDNVEPATNASIFAVVAEFASAGALVRAARALRDAGFTQWDTYTPFPLHDLDEAIGIKPTRLPWLVLGGGLTGLAIALVLQWWTNAVDYPFRISGKPFFSLPANIPVAFELTILLAAFAAFFGMIAINRLFLLHHPLQAVESFRKATADGFFLAVQAADPRFDQAELQRLLQSYGAEHIEICPAAPQQALPRATWLVGSVLLMLFLVPPALIMKARASKSADPPLRIDFGMAQQPSYRSQGIGAFFEDQRAERKRVIGTVARGSLPDDDKLNLGRSAGAWLVDFPVEVTPERMKRGRKNYEIFCAPCHGLAGAGDGLTAKRADALQEGTWVPPTSIHADHVRKQAVGELFNTITHGIRKMPAYGSRIPVDDRWSIVLYLRALQRSQDGRSLDVPPELLPALK